MVNAPTETNMLHIRAAGATDAGCVRAHNEDAQLVDVTHGLFIVADGVGGHAYGDVASRMVVDVLPRIIKRRIADSRDPCTDNDATIRAMLGRSLNELSRYIHSWSKEVSESSGMGATVVVALVTNHHVHIAHMGDSRAYLFREGELLMLTQDHSIVGLLLQHGEITLKEAESHPAKGYLTRYVGMEAEVDPDLESMELEPGDRLLLCTDGLWGTVSREGLVGILAKRSDPETTCRELVAAGKIAGGQDNLTAVVVDA